MVWDWNDHFDVRVQNGLGGMKVIFLGSFFVLFFFLLFLLYRGGPVKQDDEKSKIILLIIESIKKMR